MNDQVIRLYGTTWCTDCKRAKKFFGEHRVRYEFVDVDDNPEGIRVVEEVNRGKRIIPTIFFPDDSVLVEPSNAELAEKLHLQTSPECAFYDLVVVGGGPSALTAALYAAREGIETLVVERSGLGGQAGITERLDNYPGFPEGIGGGEFADRVVEQCRRFGVEMLSATEVAAIGSDDQGCWARLGNGEEVRAYAMLLAPGSTYRRLGVLGEEDFIGAGVHFCATCDGPFYRDQEVLVIGGGNSAVEEAIFLTRFASQVTIVHRSAQLSATKVAQEKALETPKISVELETVVDEFRGNGHLSTVVLRNLRNGERREVQKSAVFVFIGLQPNTEFLSGVVKLDERGFIATGPMLNTSLDGVYAAGDARAGSTKQLVSAAGEGATAALMIRQYLERKKAVSTHREE
ncbi:MAG TPA: FAD-dependent oxidoreductase [Chloroflexota bacterium]|nr:FAD-dependent oxidoreductase [Chloroflexota bacterium]